MANEFIIRKGYKSLAASEVTGSLKTTGDITVSGTGLSTVAGQLYVGQTSDYFGSNTNIQLNSGASNKTVGIRSNILYLYSFGDGSEAKLIFGDGSANFGLFSNDTEFALYNYGTSSNSITVNRSTHAATFAGKVTIPIGSTSAPSLNFAGFTDTGLSKGTYDTTKDQIQFSVDGGFKARIFEAGVESYANLYFNGDVRTFGSLWHATAGTSGVGYRFENTADSKIALDLDVDGNATFLGSTTSDKVNINQAADEQGLEIKGYDDHSSSDIKLQINSAGHARLSQTTDGGSGYLFLQAENYLQLIAGTFVYTQNQIRIYDEGSIAFGSHGDFLAKYYDSSDEFRIVETTTGTKGLRMDTDGNVIFTDDVTIQGNLTLTGDINTETVNNLDVVDKLITLGKGQSEANSNGSGILVDGSNASLLWDESNNTWDFNKSLDVVGNIAASGNFSLADNQMLLWGGNSILQHTGTATNIGDNSSGTSLVLSGLNATFSGVLKIPSYIEHVGDTDSFFGFNSTDTWKLRLGGGDRMIVDTNRISSNVHISLASGKYLEFLGTGALLNIDIAGWNSGVQEHNILYAGWTSSTGDYLSIKVAGNSTGNHGNLIIGDNGLWFGRMDTEETAVATDSATNPNGNANYFRVDTSGNGTFAGNLNIPSGNLTIGSDTNEQDFIIYGNDTGEKLMWDGSESRLVINHDTDDFGLGIFTVSSAQMTQPQLKVGRDANQYWGVYTADRDAHLVHRQDETSGIMTTRFDQWDSNTSDTTGKWEFRSGDGTGGSMTTALTLDQSGAATFSNSIDLTAGQVKLRTDVALDHDGSSLYIKAPSAIYFYPGNNNKGNISTGGTLTLSGGVSATSGTGHFSLVNASAYQLNGTYIVDSSRNLVNIGSITTGNSILISYSGNDGAGIDAGLKIMNDGSDWGAYIRKASNANFGLRIDSGGGNAISVYSTTGGSTKTFNVNGGNGNTDIAGDLQVGTSLANFEAGFGVAIADKKYVYGAEFQAENASIQIVLGRNNGTSVQGRGAIGADATNAFAVWNTTSTSRKFEVTHDGNTTIAGDLTVTGGDISLSGTGRIQGIDTVSAATDAANKAYVDANAGGISNVVEDTTPQLGGNLDMNGKMLFETDQRNSIDLVDHSSYTWLRNAQGGWVFQQGTAGDNWTLSYNIFLPAGNTAGNNDQFMQLGQRASNATNGSYKGTRIVQYKGGVVDGQLKASLGYFSGDTVEGVTDTHNAGIFLSTANRGVSGLFGSSYARNLITSDGSATIEIGGNTSLISLIKLNAGSSSTNGVVSFMTKGSERMRVHHDGKVGIGVTSPTSPLTVKSNSISSQTSGIAIQANGSTDDIIRMGEKSTNGGRLHMFEGGTEKIAFYTDGTDNHISAGQVGIGLSNPSHLLHVQGDDTDGVLVISRTSNTDQKLFLRSGAGSGEARVASQYHLELKAGLGGSDAYDLSLSTSDGVALRVDGSNRNVGINETSPLAKLEVGGSIKAIGRGTGHTSEAGLTISYDTSNAIGLIETWTSKPLLTRTYNYQAFDISGNEKMRISSAGVGIGTSSPAELLEVDGSIKVGSLKIQNVSAGGRIGFNRNTANGAIYNSSYEAFQVQSNGSGYLETQAYNSSGAYQGSLYFTTAGNLGIGNSSTAAKLDVEAGALGSTSGDSTTAAILRAGRQNLIFRDTRTANGSDWNNATFKIIAQIDSTNHQSIDFVNDSGYLEHIDIRTGNQVFHSRFTSAGRLGIGTTTPSEPLDVVGTARMDNAIVEGTLFAGTSLAHWGDGDTNIAFATDRITQKAGNVEFIDFSNTTQDYITLGGSGDIDARLQGGSGYVFIQGSNGYIGINDASPSFPLDISGNTKVSGNLTVSSNIGIGTDSPSYKLQVQGTGYINETLYVNGQTTINDDLIVDHNIIGNSKNFATSNAWASGSGTQTGYYGGNFSGDSQGIVKYDVGPFGARELIQETVPDSGNDYDGGWNKTITELDINKSHLSVVYVKRTTSQSSGNFYHGTGTTAGQILNLNGTNNTNPYFMATGVSILPENVWCVSIGIIQASHDSNTTVSGQYNDRVGIYRLDTGQKLNTATTYKFGSGGATLTNGHRVFLYYSTDNATTLQFARPGFYEMNGDAPTFESLVGRPVAIQINQSGVPTLADGVTAAEIRTLIGAGTSDASTLDSIDSSQFLRSDTTDSASGNLTFTGNITQNGGTFLSYGDQTSNLDTVWQVAGTGRDRGIYPFRFQAGASNAPGTNNNANWGLNIFSHGGSGGGYPYGIQLAGSDASSGENSLQLRTVSNGSFSSWKKVFHEGHLPTMAEAGVTTATVEGLGFLRSDAADTSTGEILFDAGFKSDSILLTGAQNFDNISRSGFYNLYNTQTSSTNSPPLTYGTMIVVGGNKQNNSFGLQIAHERTGTGLYVRGMNDSSSTWYDWDEIWTSGTDGDGSGLDADLLDGMQPKSGTGAAGSNQILRSHSNGYLYLKNWIDVGSSGLFSTTTNGAHFYPNGASDYGAWRSNGSRGGYNGIVFDMSGTVYNALLSNATEIGLFNDADNEWYLKATRNEGVQLYYNNGEKLKTTSAGVDVTGNVTHDGLSMTSGTDIDQLTTVNMTYQLASNTWTDTGINSSELATGTYAIQLFVDDHNAGGGHYDVVYSGMMSWYGSNTNSSNVDEIVLHRVGHATNNSIIQLRTQMHSSGGDNVMLQIKQNFSHSAAMSGTTDGKRHNFKFRRLI